MKTSDCIAQIVKRETDTVFGVTGGCIINVVDSFHKAGIKVIAIHHEQSAAIAADAYARFKGFGCCFGTSGPGITNLITGVACSYYDSVPVLVIGGQVPSKFLDGGDRQMGFQEVDGVALMKPITKMARRYKQQNELQACIRAAKTGRKGPVYVEIPDEVQRRQEEYTTECTYESADTPTRLNINLNRWKRPLLVIGRGAKHALLDINVPFLCTWGCRDRFSHFSPYYRGDFGITGSPEGNALLKQADCIVMVGTRMDTHQVPDWSKFALDAHKIAVGLQFPHDVNERYNIDLDGRRLDIIGPDWCLPCKPNASTGPAYELIDQLSAQAGPDDIIIPDMGQVGCIAFQRWGIKPGQRLFNGMNHSPMGYALPGAIGAAMATGRRVIVIIGDGSLMMNLQDLATIVQYNLPINIFVVNNGGYGMIRQTQADWPAFLAQGVACDLPIPSVQKLAEAFGIEYTHEMGRRPSICEYNISDTQIKPKWKFGEDL